MNQRFRHGLVVGKFCPLHRGHEHLIFRAQAQCDQVSVLSYAKPGFPGYDRDRRSGWLRSRCPDVQSYVIDDAWLTERCRARGVSPRKLPEDDAPDDVHRHFVAWLLLEVLAVTVDSVFTSESYGDGFAAVLTAASGVPVAHVCVDPDRTTWPASGTLIRRDPLACRHLLGPEVYADFVPRVALLGGESTGKTTLARALSEALQTCWVPEYGRTLWECQGGVLAFEDMECIARTQVLHEQQQALAAHGVLVCDTTPLTTLFYSQALFGHATEALEQMARRPYAVTLLCAPDFAFVQDGTRQDQAFRTRQQAWYRTALQELGREFTELTGPVERRVQAAAGRIGARLGR